LIVILNFQLRRYRQIAKLNLTNFQLKGCSVRGGAPPRRWGMRVWGSLLANFDAIALLGMLEMTTKWFLGEYAA
jgi:hypothetical protein